MIRPAIANVDEVGVNVRSWVYTGRSRFAERKSAVVGVNGGFSKKLRGGCR
jgi:hypothetical protein